MSSDPFGPTYREPNRSDYDPNAFNNYMKQHQLQQQQQSPPYSPMPPPPSFPPPRPGYVTMYDDNGPIKGRPYYYNSQTNHSYWAYDGGKTGKTGKKKKRIIKRKKTYKKGRYTKRKTIKR